MKQLKDILRGIEVLDRAGSLDKDISGLHFDSRQVKKGFLFVAVKGLTVDGHHYIANAEKSGAEAVVCEKMPESRNNGTSYLVVANTSEALGRMASNFYDNPSSKLKLIGITGTNGKTTTATLLYHLFLYRGIQTGLISTIANCINQERLYTRFTTPDAVQINELLKNMVDHQCQYAFMEVSSHALKQMRVAGLKFQGALFTNITHEHLDYHGSFDDYIASKKMLFDHYLEEDAFALINADDRHARIMVQNSRAGVYTFALKTSADFKGKILEKHIDGTLFSIGHQEIWTPFVGQFNVYNLLGVYGAARLLGYRKTDLMKDISKLKPVEGRFETIRSPKYQTAVVDYAHTPDALENVLSTIQGVQKPNQRLITVVGAGGDRDTTKRPQMTNIALRYSDRVVLTSDNPRSEDPQSIINDMLSGITPEEEKKVVSITDRKEAIRAACMMAEKDDIILVAGKGHETYQEVNGTRHHFDDRQVIRELFNMQTNK
jgi:UDP-N-acetylmuramoyl-L-alanyl-D-glutamate--2,6-diaminopimelate ligase